MERIIFEDAKKIEDPKVTINGVEYTVTPGKYTANVVLSAFVLNKLQDNVENGIKEGDKQILSDMSTKHVGTNIKADTKAGHGTKHAVGGTTNKDFSCVADDVNLIDINWLKSKTLPTSAGNIMEFQDITLAPGAYRASNKLDDGNVLLANHASFIFCTESNASVVSVGLNNGITITEEQAKQISKVRIYYNAEFGSGRTIKELKLQKGSVATPYSKYGYGTVEIFSKNGDNIVSDVTQSRPLPSKDDKVDFDTGKIVRKKLFDGTENWVRTAADTSSTRLSFYVLLENESIKSCSHFNIVDITNIANVGEYISCSNIAIQIGITSSKLATQDAAGFRAWLASNNVSVILEEDIVCTNKIYQFAGSTEFWERSGGELELSVTNNEAVAQMNTDIERLQVKQCVYDRDISYKVGYQATNLVVFQKPICTKKENRVFLSGVVMKTDGTNIASQTKIAVLPEGYRPLKRLIFPCWGDNYSCRIDVYQNGELEVNSTSGSLSSVTLDGIQFEV